MFRLEIFEKGKLIHRQTKGSLMQGITGIGSFLLFRPLLGLRFFAAATANQTSVSPHTELHCCSVWGSRAKTFPALGVLIGTD